MPEMSKKTAKKLLADVPHEHAFRFHDGRILRNMGDLGEALKTMKKATFAFHASAQKNDFGKWVREVIGDQKLARDLDRSSKRTQAAKKVAERVAFLSSKMS
jgi:hypothetical protein